jgi:aconitate decarboxylase
MPEQTKPSRTPTPMTQQIARFTSGLRETDIPEAARRVVRLGFTDYAAVLLAGWNEPVTRATRRMVRQDSGGTESRMGLHAERSGAAYAALVGAVASHALDWDDYAFSNHPSVVLAPTAIAVADAVGASGARIAAAYVAGYEVWGTLMRREPGHLHSKGWHPTAVLGPIAAAVTAAVLMRLDESACRNAVALAASFAGGVMANFGTMAKPLHAGRAAQSGIVAARYAAGGFDAGAHALESPLGLMQALSPDGAVDVYTPMPLGKVWLIEQLSLNIKKYPTVGASQRTIDALVALCNTFQIDASQVREAVPLVSERHAAVMPFHTPQTALEAKFSLEFVVAAALLRRKVGLTELSDAFVQSETVQALMRKVRITTTPDSDPHYPGAAPADFVRLLMLDGSEHVTEKVRRASGHADSPLSTAQLWDKFSECAILAGLTDTPAHALFDAMQNIDGLAGADDIPTLFI